MPSPAQLDTLWNLSDMVLYPEAVAFLRRLVYEEECMPLPTAQVIGLQNTANASSYAELERFIKHQRDRDWPESKQNIKILYTELDKLFTTMKNKRLCDEFHLLQEKCNSKEKKQEVDELMALVAHDFIQHLVAENGVLATEKVSRKAAERARRR